MNSEPILKTPSRRQLTLAGIATCMIIIVSAVMQAGAYFTGLNIPDLLTAGPTIIALLFVLPSILKAHPMKGWGAFLGAFGLCLVVYFLAAAGDEMSGDGLRTLASIALAISCSFVGFCTGLDRGNRQFSNWSIIIVCILSSLGLIALIIAKPATDDMPKNIIGGELMYLAVLAVAARLDLTGKKRSIMILAPLLAIEGLITGHRVLLGLGAATFVADKLLPWQRSKLIHRIAILIAASISVLIVLMYLYSNSLPSFESWNLFVQAKTGRQITSGRQLIWPLVVQQIMRHPYTGSGFAITSEQITGTNFSTHNSFLMILLQVGWVGFIAVLILLATVILKGTSGKYTHWRTLFTILMVLVMIHCTFETVLIQNNFRISSLIWLSLGYICARIPVKRSRARLAESTTTSLKLVHPHIINSEVVV